MDIKKTVAECLELERQAVLKELEMLRVRIATETNQFLEDMIKPMDRMFMMREGKLTKADNEQMTCHCGKEKFRWRTTPYQGPYPWSTPNHHGTPITFQEELVNTSDDASERPAILQEREKTHGDFRKMAVVAHCLKTVVYTNAGANMTLAQREALDMICTKLARILCGNPLEKDHWVDIAGYANLGAESCV